MLARQNLPVSLAGDRHFWKLRLEDIAAFERYLARQGTLVLKFYLNVSREEQKRRFLERLDTPDKNWKFSAADLTERTYWADYMAAYEEAITATAAPWAPWYVVPGDNKWFTRLVVVQAMIAALEGLKLKPMKLPPDNLARLEEARRHLQEEGG